MQLLRRAHRIAGRLVGDPAVARRLLRDSVIVFLYHEITDQPSEFNSLLDLNVRPRIFAEQLDLITESFHVIGPEELMSGDHELPAALITFDDGDPGYFREAVPIMRGKGLPSVCFVNMGTIHGELCWAGLVAYLAQHEPGFARRELGKPFSLITEDDVSGLVPPSELARVAEQARVFRGAIASEKDLRSIANDSLVHIGNHLYNHRNAATLSADSLRTEYLRNQVLIDAHRRGTRLFSYPFGEPGTCMSAATTELLQREGAVRLFTAYSLPNNRPKAVYHRVAMFESVRTPEDMYHAIMRNYLRERLGRGPGGMH